MTPNKLPPLPEPSIRFGAQSGLSGLECYSAEQMEDFATAYAASLGTAPDGSWLWCKLMSWLRSRRLPPAEYGDLFAIVKEAHDLHRPDAVEPVGDEAMALHWIDRYACGIDDEPQLDRIRDALYQDNEALRQSQSLPAGAVAGINYDVVRLFANDAEVEKVDFNWLIRCIRDCVTVNNLDSDGVYYRWLRDEATKEQLDDFSVRRGTRLAADRLCANETDAERNAAKALNKPSPKSEAELPYDNAGDDLGPQQDRSNCAWPFCTGCDFPGTDCGPEKE